VEKSGAAMSSRFVLDCSLAISWCIEDEQTAATEAILDSLTQGGSALVPSLWLWEINNVLLLAERAGRLDAAKRHQQLVLLQKLPISIDEDAHKQAWNDTSTLAATHRLTVYDAAYLELALRQGLHLGSLDGSLRLAARKAGIKCLPEKI
jgi:predicted nucleic acid-binding protein